MLTQPIPAPGPTKKIRAVPLAFEGSAKLRPFIKKEMMPVLESEQMGGAAAWEMTSMFSEGPGQPLGDSVYFLAPQPGGRTEAAAFIFSCLGGTVPVLAPGL